MSDQSFTATPQQRPPGGVTGAGFMPGRSGNPGGRKHGIEALAREHTAAAIATLVRELDRPANCVAAAVALLNRGWGLPKQTIAGDGETPLAIHFTWAPATPQIEDEAKVIDAEG